METASQKNFKPGLSACVEEKLKEYFDALGGVVSAQNLYNIIIEEVERPLLMLVLRQTEGNQIKASEILGLNRNTLRKKLTQYKINPNSYKYEPI